MEAARFDFTSKQFLPVRLIADSRHASYITHFKHGTCVAIRSPPLQQRLTIAFHVRFLARLREGRAQREAEVRERVWQVLIIGDG